MPEGLSEPPRAASWWQCVVRGVNGIERFVSVRSARYPDGARVELNEETARIQIGDDALCVVTFGEASQVTGLEVMSWFAPKAPHLWFAELRESTARPPAVNLVAFTGAGQPAGALLDRTELAELPVGSDDQVGALRWYPATGEVDQVYVQPAWRRRGVAGVLLAAGGTLSVARGWPRFWGDGQRTEQGELLRNASSWRWRGAELTHVAPAMTPARSGRWHG